MVKCMVICAQCRPSIQLINITFCLGWPDKLFGSLKIYSKIHFLDVFQTQWRFQMFIWHFGKKNEFFWNQMFFEMLNAFLKLWKKRRHHFIWKAFGIQKWISDKFWIFSAKIFGKRNPNRSKRLSVMGCVLLLLSILRLDDEISCANSIHKKKPFKVSRLVGFMATTRISQCLRGVHLCWNLSWACVSVG